MSNRIDSVVTTVDEPTRRFALLAVSARNRPARRQSLRSRGLSSSMNHVW